MAPDLLLDGSTPVILQSAEFQEPHRLCRKALEPSDLPHTSAIGPVNPRSTLFCGARVANVGVQSPALLLSQQPGSCHIVNCGLQLIL